MEPTSKFSLNTNTPPQSPQPGKRDKKTRGSLLNHSEAKMGSRSVSQNSTPDPVINPNIIWETLTQLPPKPNSPASLDNNNIEQGASTEKFFDYSKAPPAETSLDRQREKLLEARRTDPGKEKARRAGFFGLSKKKYETIDNFKKALEEIEASLNGPTKPWSICMENLFALKMVDTKKVLETNDNLKTEWQRLQNLCEKNLTDAVLFTKSNILSQVTREEILLKIAYNVDLLFLPGLNQFIVFGKNLNGWIFSNILTIHADKESTAAKERALKIQAQIHLLFKVLEAGDFDSTYIIINAIAHEIIEKLPLTQHYLPDSTKKAIKNIVQQLEIEHRQPNMALTKKMNELKDKVRTPYLPAILTYLTTLYEEHKNYKAQIVREYYPLTCLKMARMEKASQSLLFKNFRTLLKEELVQARAYHELEEECKSLEEKINPNAVDPLAQQLSTFLARKLDTKTNKLNITNKSLKDNLQDQLAILKEIQLTLDTPPCEAILKEQEKLYLIETYDKPLKEMQERQLATIQFVGVKEEELAVLEKNYKDALEKSREVYNHTTGEFNRIVQDVTDWIKKAETYVLAHQEMNGKTGERLQTLKTLDKTHGKQDPGMDQVWDIGLALRQEEKKFMEDKANQKELKTNKT